MSDEERIEGIRVLGVCIETLKGLLNLGNDTIRQESELTILVLIARMKKLAMEMD